MDIPFSEEEKEIIRSIIGSEDMPDDLVLWQFYLFTIAENLSEEGFKAKWKILSDTQKKLAQKPYAQPLYPPEQYYMARYFYDFDESMWDGVIETSQDPFVSQYIDGLATVERYCTARFFHGKTREEQEEFVKIYEDLYKMGVFDGLANK